MNFDRQWVVGYPRQRLEEIDQVRYKQLLRDTFRETFRFEQSIQTLPTVSTISHESSLIAPHSFTMQPMILESQGKKYSHQSSPLELRLNPG